MLMELATLEPECVTVHAKGLRHPLPDFSHAAITPNNAPQLTPSWWKGLGCDVTCRWGHYVHFWGIGVTKQLQEKGISVSLQHFVHTVKKRAWYSLPAHGIETMDACTAPQDFWAEHLN